MAELHGFAINVDNQGHGTVALDGTDISHAVAGFSITSAPGQQTVLMLAVRIEEMLAPVTGEARVVIPAETDELLRSLGWTPPDGAP